MVQLTVNDGNGGIGTTTVRVDAGNLPPQPVIATPTSGQQFSVGEILTLSGSANDPEDGSLGDVHLTWEVRQHHHTHYHPYLDPTVGNNLTVVAPEPEDFFSTDDSYIEVRLTATDSKGLSTTVSRNVEPRSSTSPSRRHRAGWRSWSRGNRSPRRRRCTGGRTGRSRRCAGPGQRLGCPAVLDVVVRRRFADPPDHTPAAPATYTAKFTTGPPSS